MTTSVTVNGFGYRPLRNGATGTGGRHSKASTRGNFDVGTYGGAPRALWGFERQFPKAYSGIPCASQYCR